MHQITHYVIHTNTCLDVNVLYYIIIVKSCTNTCFDVYIIMYQKGLDVNAYITHCVICTNTCLNVNVLDYSLCNQYKYMFRC